MPSCDADSALRWSALHAESSDDVARVVAEGTDAASALDIPKTDVSRAGEDSALVSTPQDGLNVIRMTFEFLKASSACNVPQTNCLATRAGECTDLSEIERDIVDGIRVTFKDPEAARRCRVPQANRVISFAGS